MDIQDFFLARCLPFPITLQTTPFKVHSLNATYPSSSPLFKSPFLKSHRKYLIKARSVIEFAKTLEKFVSHLN